MSSSLERYVSDNSLRVSLLLIASSESDERQLFGISDRNMIDYVIASGKSYI